MSLNLPESEKNLKFTHSCVLVYGQIIRLLGVHVHISVETVFSLCNF